MKLTVKTMPVKDLIPYANNARIHSADQIDTIAASISEFGFNDPVGVWTNPDGQTEIVEGHGRVIAAEQLGLDKVPTINLDHLTDEERRAYSIVHNQTTDNSTFDFEILSVEVESLDFDWESFGVAEGTATAVEFFPEPTDIGGSTIYAINVVCKDEADQEKVYTDLTAQGYECRLVVS